MKNSLINLVIVLCMLLISFIGAELIFRWMLFNGGSRFEFLRKPDMYSDWDNEELYWILRVKWKQNGDLNNHASEPFVGWSHDFKTPSFKHIDEEHVNGRTPVLWFGDSFSQCVKDVTCFQVILNNDQDFKKKYYVLNYGTGGFGLDQITYTMTRALDVNKSPFVVFGFLTTDLDRSMLSIRDMPKPYYTIESDSLHFHSDHLNGTTGDYVEQKGLPLTSLLWRKFLFSKLLNEHFPNIAARLRGDEHFTENKKILNKKILEKAIHTLREKNIPFVFLIFYGWGDFIVHDEDNWRFNLIKQTLLENKVPFIWAGDVLKKHINREVEGDDQRFFILGDGHPTTYFNELISEEVKQYIYQHPVSK